MTNEEIELLEKRYNFTLVPTNKLKEMQEEIKKLKANNNTLTFTLKQEIHECKKWQEKLKQHKSIQNAQVAFIDDVCGD